MKNLRCAALKLRGFMKNDHFKLKKNIDFMGKRQYFFASSIIMIILTMFLLYYKGLNLGVDFTGGVVVEAKFGCEQTIAIAEVRDIIGKHFQNPTTQSINQNNQFIFRFGVTDDSLDQTNQNLVAKLNNIFPQEYRFQILSMDFIGPQISSSLSLDSFYALCSSLLAMSLYLCYRFNIIFACGAILALIHDIIFIFGFYIVTNIEFNLTSIAAILTIVGFSVNDSVIIYDRIRENISLFKKQKHEFMSVADMIEVINKSVNATLPRTCLTVLTTLLSNLALILFGGETIYHFSVVVFVGIIFGTYSSIYISAPILLLLSQSYNKLIGRKKVMC